MLIKRIKNYDFLLFLFNYFANQANIVTYVVLDNIQWQTFSMFSYTGSI